MISEILSKMSGSSTLVHIFGIIAKEHAMDISGRNTCKSVVIHSTSGISDMVSSTWSRTVCRMIETIMHRKNSVLVVLCLQRPTTERSRDLRQDSQLVT